MKHLKPLIALPVMALVGLVIDIADSAAATAQASSHVDLATPERPPTPPPPPADGPPAPPPPPPCDAVTVSGTVTSFHYARRGELDGLVLSDGTAVRFPPHEGADVDAIVDVGSGITVTGCTHVGPRGDAHVRAQALTNEGSSETWSQG